MGSKRLTPTTVKKMASKCLLFYFVFVVYKIFLSNINNKLKIITQQYITNKIN